MPSSALGFLLFFMLGYRFDSVCVFSVVKHIPVVLTAAVFISAFAAQYAVFASGRIPYRTVFGVLVYGTNIDESTSYILGFAAYVAAFVGAIVLSICFLRVMVNLRNCRALAHVSSDTMPLYLAHGYAIHALCLLIAPAPMLPDWVTVGLFLALASIVVILFSSKA